MEEDHPVISYMYTLNYMLLFSILQVLSRCANGRTRTVTMAPNAAATTVNRRTWGPARGAYGARCTSPAMRTSTATSTSNAADNSAAVRHFGGYARRAVTVANPNTFAGLRKDFTIDFV